VDNLNLIDWRMVGFASLWITGLAVVLATLGFVDYSAGLADRKFRQEVGRPDYQAAINIGLTAFSLGLLGSSRTWWETALWGVLAVAFAAFAIQALRRQRQAGKESPTVDDSRSTDSAGPPSGSSDPNPGGSTGQPSVLLVCTANRCRSPMAAALLTQLLEREGLASHYRVDTAGTWAKEGEPAASLAQEVMRERGLDLSHHRSRRVSGDLLRGYQLVLVMEAGHREAMLAEFPEVGARLHLLTSMAGERYNIEDPAEGTIEAYRILADELEDALRRGLPRILRLLE
jgi:protein-tyrosine phosphatase